MFLSYHVTRSLGFTLVELLVAMALLSIILLALFKAQVDLMALNQEAFFQTMALLQLEKMGVLIHLAPSRYGEYLTAWDKENQSILPHPQSEITHENGVYRIALTWRAQRFQTWHCLKPASTHRSCLSYVAR